MKKNLERLWLSDGGYDSMNENCTVYTIYFFFISNVFETYNFYA